MSTPKPPRPNPAFERLASDVREMEGEVSAAADAWYARAMTLGN